MADVALELVRVRGRRFLEWSTRWGRSAEAGPVSSQYRDELQSEAEHVEAHALYACGKPVGAFTVGFHPLPRGGLAGRLDLVLSDPTLRGRGVGGLMMACFVDTCLRRTAPEVSLLSAVAVHPSVRHVLGGAFGFEPASVGDVPLYQRILGSTGGSDAGEARAELVTTGQRERRRRMGRLRSGCVTCRARAWGEPWCVRPGEAKPPVPPPPVPVSDLREAS